MDMKRKTKTKKYTSISIPIDLAKLIDKVVESGRYGYKNRADFVMDVIRDRLRKLGVIQ